MPAPLIVTFHADVQGKLLTVTVERNVTDALTSTVTVERREVSGPLNTLGGLAALRNNLVTWVKAQSGYAGAIDVTP